jgi:ABC-2 type transport system permease protein
MNLAGICDKLGAVLRRDLLTSLRHRNGAVVLVAGIAAELAGFYYLSRAIGPTFRPDGLDYYSFLLIGTAMYGFMIGGMGAFVHAVEQAQMTGTMEVLMTTSTPAPVMVALSALSAFARTGLNMLLYLLAGSLILGVKLHASIAGVIAVLGLALVVAIALGLVGAAMQVAMQKGTAVVWLSSVVGGLLTGTVFPVAALPTVLRKFSAFIPLTSAVEGLRIALFRGDATSLLLASLAKLGVFAVFLLPLSLALFAHVLKKARLEGTLSFY